jgi:hypothetical protein
LLPNVIPSAVIVAAAAGLLFVTGIAAYPPSPSQRRSLGCPLVVLSFLNAAIVTTALC